MQRGDEQDVVTTLDLIGLLALQLPIGVIDQDQDSRAPGHRNVSLTFSTFFSSLCSTSPGWESRGPMTGPVY